MPVVLALIAREYEPLGELLPLPYATVARNLAALIDDEVGRPVAMAAGEPEIDAAVRDALPRLRDLLAALGLVVVKGLAVGSDEALRSTWAAAVTSAGESSGWALRLDDPARGDLLLTLHTIGNTIPRILAVPEQESPEAEEALLCSVTALVAMTSEDLVDPIGLAAYARRFAHEFSRIVKSGLRKPQSPSTPATSREEDTRLSIAALKAWLEEDGSATAPG